LAERTAGEATIGGGIAGKLIEASLKREALCH